VSVHKVGYFAARHCIFSPKGCKNAGFKEVAGLWPESIMCLHYGQTLNKIMEYAPISHNRTVYASPPIGGFGFRSARSATRILPKLLDRFCKDAYTVDSYVSYKSVYVRRHKYRIRGVRRNCA
jgi:hypothetical protein